jgi:hypothetical protein
MSLVKAVLRGNAGLRVDLELTEPRGMIPAGPLAQVYLNDERQRFTNPHRELLAEVLRGAAEAYVRDVLS